MLVCKHITFAQWSEINAFTKIAAFVIQKSCFIAGLHGDMSLSSIQPTLSTLKTCQVDIGTGMDIVSDVALDLVEAQGTVKSICCCQSTRSRCKLYCRIGSYSLNLCCCCGCQQVGRWMCPAAEKEPIWWHPAGAGPKNLIFWLLLCSRNTQLTALDWEVQ